MCTYLAITTPVAASALRVDGSWLRVDTAVVAFDHPQDAPVEHALSVDLRVAGGDPTDHVTIELDAESARRLAETILAALEAPEAAELIAFRQ